MTPYELRKKSAEIYSSVKLSLHERHTTINRPLYAPFHLLLDWIPYNSNLVDIGCRTGTFMLLVDSLRNLEFGYGCDLDPCSIEIANLANKNPKISFECIDAMKMNPIEEMQCGCVSCIDVFHHIPVPNKYHFLEKLLQIIPSKCRLIFKDLDARPKWKAIINDLIDDLPIKFQNNYETMTSMESIICNSGFDIIKAKRCDMYVLNHYYIVAKKK